MDHPVSIGPVRVGSGAPLVLIAGPCVLESEKIARDTAEGIARICRGLDLPFIFKSSYDKANRTSHKSFRGHGAKEGLKLLAKIKKELKVPVITDIHSVPEAAEAARVADCLQIPAFLCRQTDLLEAAGKTGKPVNVKKGQFASPQEMRFAVEKVRAGGGGQVLVTERGFSFGYNNLVVDMRSLVILRGLGVPVVFDGTHSVQLPGGAGDRSGGQREFVASLSAAAAAVGIDALFLEVHPEPDEALSDGPNMIPVHELKTLLERVLAVDATTRGRTSAQKKTLELEIFIDGGSRGNPGPSAIGAVLLTSQGKVAAEISRAIGVSTNNQAEYEALLAALAKAHELGAVKVTVKTDSELLARQMSGEYRVTDEKMKRLYREALKLKGNFASLTILNISREQNKRADKLVNMALDRS